MSAKIQFSSGQRIHPTFDTISIFVVLHIVRHCCYTEAKNYVIEEARGDKRIKRLLTHTYLFRHLVMINILFLEILGRFETCLR